MNILKKSPSYKEKLVLQQYFSDFGSEIVVWAPIMYVWSISKEHISDQLKKDSTRALKAIFIFFAYVFYQNWMSKQNWHSRTKDFLAEETKDPELDAAQQHLPHLRVIGDEHLKSWYW